MPVCGRDSSVASTQRVQVTHFFWRDDVTQTASANCNNEDRKVTFLERRKRSGSPNSNSNSRHHSLA
eukprot:354548-Chlamydomonas_euryale.AAC.15